MDDSVSLRPDQVADLAFYMANPKCMNLSEPGTGKTPSVVVMQYHLWSTHKVGTAFVMPKKLLEKNRREILRFTPLKPEDVVIVDGPPKKVKAALESEAKVFLMGFRRWTLCYNQLPNYVKALHIDEFHKGFKSADSAASRAMFEVFRTGRFQWFIPMTGTLISGKLTSAYPAIHVIEPRYYASAKAFLYQHAIFDYNDKIIGWKNHDKLTRIFGRHGIRRLFRDIHGDQEIVYNHEIVEMSPRQRKVYDEFEEEALLELERFFVDGTQPGVGFIRARQIMEHPDVFPDLTTPGETINIIPGETPGKLELLDLHLEDHENSGKPLLIFSAMILQQDTIEKMLKDRGMKYGVINGRSTNKEADQVDQAFQRGEINTICCSPMVADAGYNWQWCGKQEVEHIIFVTTDFLDTTFIQAMQRAIRENRTGPLRCTIMEYSNSIDQRNLRIVYDKSVEANKVDPTRPILQLSKWEKEYNNQEKTI